VLILRWVQAQERKRKKRKTFRLVYFAQCQNSADQNRFRKSSSRLGKRSKRLITSRTPASNPNVCLLLHVLVYCCAVQPLIQCPRQSLYTPPIQILTGDSHCCEPAVSYNSCSLIRKPVCPLSFSGIILSVRYTEERCPLIPHDPAILSPSQRTPASPNRHPPT
jgi:hypothetical protein